VFQSAKLTGVDFSYSNLSRARLSGLDLQGVNLARSYLYLTQLNDANLSGATGLTQDQLDMACGNAGTKLPAGLSPPQSWPCAEEAD
jgi:uncharacterized protein YjbI with pentapeptide repeats